MVETVDPGSRNEPSEAQRLAEASTKAFISAKIVRADTGQQAEALASAQELAGLSALAEAYQYLQRVVGIIAVSLPPVVALGNLAFGGEMKGSISAYYYTRMGNVFVGSLCALAVFFLSYNYKPLPGFELDHLLARFASAAAVGVALFPTTSDAANASGGEKTVAVVHLICAGTLFLLLAFFSLFLFTKSDESKPMSDQKRRRNLVYRTCGIIITAAIVLVGVSNIVTPPSSLHSLFWLETIAVIAFGVSWLVKGGFLGILADPPRPAPVPPTPSPSPTP
jgi:hypothetical protein